MMMYFKLASKTIVLLCFLATFSLLAQPTSISPSSAKILPKYGISKTHAKKINEETIKRKGGTRTSIVVHHKGSTTYEKTKTITPVRQGTTTTSSQGPSKSTTTKRRNPNRTLTSNYNTIAKSNTGINNIRKERAVKPPVAPAPPTATTPPPPKTTSSNVIRATTPVKTPATTTSYSTRISSPTPSYQTSTPARRTTSYSNSSRYIKNYGSSSSNYVPTFSDAVYRSRMNSIPSRITLNYNRTVRAFIHVYTVKKRNVAEKALAFVDTYFPMFERTLAEFGLPDELKYLAITESALNTNAKSSASAVGLWQLIRSTGREMGLTVTSTYDERRDPVKATRAACKFLKRLYRRYGDWQLVIAAYNCGPGNVNKAIRRSGKRTFWGIKHKLPRETRSYVPSYLACVYWVNFHHEHNIRPIYNKYQFALENSATVSGSGGLTLRAVAEYLNLELEELMFLNPALRNQRTPNNGKYHLRLPSYARYDFEANRNAIYAYQASGGKNRGSYVSSNRPSYNNNNSSQPRSTYARGDYSSDGNYGVSAPYTVNKNTGQIAYSSSNNSDYVNRSAGAYYYNNNSGNTSSRNRNKKVSVLDDTPSKKKLWYKVKKGDNLNLIAAWYKTSVSKIKNWNGLSGNRIRIGQKLKVLVPTSKQSYYKKVNTLSFAEKQRRVGKKSASKRSKFDKYTVRKGDTLWRIAQKFPANTVSSLRKLNGLGGRTKIKPGQRLKVKKSGKGQP